MLAVVSLDHTRAPLSLRERCAVPISERERARSSLRRGSLKAVVLSTCSRVEVYVDHPDPDAATDLALGWLAARAGINVAALAPHATAATGDAAVRRLVRVACGLESAVEGEDEILGQTRRAWLDAGIGGLSSPALDTAFRLAIRTGRQARRLGDPHASTSLADTAAARVALEPMGREQPTVLLAGTGPIGRRAARALRERLGSSVTLLMAGRTPERVAAHAAEAGARALSLDQLTEALTAADAAIVALRTNQPLIGPGVIAPRLPERPLLIADLSLPRAVEPSVGRLAGVTLHDVDGLGAREGGSTRWSRDDRRRVEQLVQQAVGSYAELTERGDAGVTLAALRIRADAIRRAQLESTLRRLPQLDAEARWMVEALTHAIVNKVLHEPTMRLRADDDGSIARQTRHLFGIEV